MTSLRNRLLSLAVLAVAAAALACSESKTPTEPMAGAAAEKSATGAKASGAASTRERSTITVDARSDGAVGTIDSINAAAKSFVLKSDRGTTTTIKWDANTVFRKGGAPASPADLKVGLRASAEGTIQTDKSILARRVEILPDVVRETFLEGTVANVNAAAKSFTVKTTSETITVATDAGTRFNQGRSSTSFADIKTGVRVFVEGAQQADGSVLARFVTIEILPPAPPAFVFGRVQSVDTAKKSFVVASIFFNVTVTTDANTRFEKRGGTATLADVVVGAFVEADGTKQTDGSILAKNVEIIR